MWFLWSKYYANALDEGYKSDYYETLKRPIRWNNITTIALLDDDFDVVNDVDVIRDVDYDCRCELDNWNRSPKKTVPRKNCSPKTTKVLHISSRAKPGLGLCFVT